MKNFVILIGVFLLQQSYAQKWTKKQIDNLEPIDQELSQKAINKINASDFERLIDRLIKVIKANKASKLVIISSISFLSKINIPSDEKAHKIIKLYLDKIANDTSNGVRMSSARGLVLSPRLSSLLKHYDSKSLFQVFLQYIFDSELIANLAGIKPISIISFPNIDAFEMFRKDNFLEKYTGTKSIRWYSPHPNTLAVYSDKAMNHLRKNKSKLKLLSNKGFDIDKDLNNKDIFNKFKLFWDGKLDVDQHSFHIISGILFGYPESDVIEYANTIIDAGKATGNNINLFTPQKKSDGVFFGWYVAGNENGHLNINDYRIEYNKILNQYLYNVKIGKSPINIVAESDMVFMRPSHCIHLLQRVMNNKY